MPTLDCWKRDCTRPLKRLRSVSPLTLTLDQLKVAEECSELSEVRTCTMLLRAATSGAACAMFRRTTTTFAASQACSRSCIARRRCTAAYVCGCTKLESCRRRHQLEQVASGYCFRCVTDPVATPCQAPGIGRREPQARRRFAASLQLWTVASRAMLRVVVRLSCLGRRPE